MRQRMCGGGSRLSAVQYGEVPGLSQKDVEIADQARALGCAGGMRYVYIDNDYDGEFPSASIGLTKARRFRSTNYEKHKQELGKVGDIRYVAFGSPSKTPRTPLEHIPGHQIPTLPDARIR